MRKIAAVAAALAASCPLAAQGPIPATLKPSVIVDTSVEPIAPGPFQPTWESLAHYRIPEWFRDAKFGIWAHWGAQCQPEQGDWYARKMYVEGTRQNLYHLAHYGPPSQFGFKDVIHEWKAEKWDPAALMALYKRAGAQYFLALAVHHDNFDNWDSKYQPWNSVRIGPHQDLIAGWAKAARAEGLRFGVSVHASHAWTWYEPAQGAATHGPYAGVPYDGRLRAKDGKGQWWDGLDPQALYAQNHPPSPDPLVNDMWNWDHGAVPPDQAYCDKFYNRTVDLIRHVHPDLIYFDDSVLPLWPVSDAGLKIAAGYYNSNLREHGGRLEAVMFGKELDEGERRCIALDIERGQSPRIEPEPFQTDTCLGDWHYDRQIYDQNRYKTAATVIRMLVDVVSKNGNLLLNVPVRGDGTIDEKERAIVEGIAGWMDVNREAIFGTRPWRVCGEGPQIAAASAKGPGRSSFNEGKGRPPTAADIRYTAKGGAVYAFVLARTVADVRLSALAAGTEKVRRVEQLGSGDVRWRQDADGLVIAPAAVSLPDDATVVFRISTETGI